ncbi:MAG: mercury methylation corrinoid protein HgcA [Thermodesulfobacteriota bacterium]
MPPSCLPAAFPGKIEIPDSGQPFVKGTLQTKPGGIPQVTSMLTAADYLGTIKARWGIGRMNYTVSPGLYALGTPTEKAPVLVTANYKMSFDCLRSALPGRDAWILVLDTKGVNVWCAAGKGTFGTGELVTRIGSSRLEQVVSGRQLILPQLGAPGVAAHLVRKQTGFSAVYGPVEAEDLPAFLDSGLKATKEMRQKRFPLRDRAALVPMELIPALKWAPVIFLVAFLAGGLEKGAPFLTGVLSNGLFAAAIMAGAIIAGAVLTPLLLPWLPGRSFSIKGAVAGLLTAVLIVISWPEPVGMGKYLPLLPVSAAFSSYLGMNFTGASTYTSLSGVKAEMKWAVPLQIIAAIVGVVGWLVALLVG